MFCTPLVGTIGALRPSSYIALLIGVIIIKRLLILESSDEISWDSRTVSELTEYPPPRPETNEGLGQHIQNPVPE